MKHGWVQWLKHTSWGTTSVLQRHRFAKQEQENCCLKRTIETQNAADVTQCCNHDHYGPYGRVNYSNSCAPRSVLCGA